MDNGLSEWLAGLASYRCVFMDLIPGEKRPPKPWRYYEEAQGAFGDICVQNLSPWLEEGKGAGFLPRGGVWVLDIDAPGEVERILSTLLKLRIFPPRVSTPSGGAHLYFRLPDEFPIERLKNHLNHPIGPDGEKMQLDFKFGPRTLLVAPGTRNAKGVYFPETPWMRPPAVDPRLFLPKGAFWHPPARPFDVDPRPPAARISRACNYLKSKKTPVSVSGNGGRKTLASVCAHLVAFLQIDPAMAFQLLTNGSESWNSRCRDKEGNPYPWSPRDLMRACENAVDAIPRAGEQLYHRRIERQARDQSLIRFCHLLAETNALPGAQLVSVLSLHMRFKEWSGREVSVAAFGRCLGLQGFPRKRFSKRRCFGVRVDLVALEKKLVLSTRA